MSIEIFVRNCRNMLPPVELDAQKASGLLLRRKSALIDKEVLHDPDYDLRP